MRRACVLRPRTEQRACRSVTPSFLLMDVQAGKVISYVYQLKDGEVAVEKIEFNAAPAPAAEQ